MADANTKALHDELTALIREKAQLHDEMIKVIRKKDTGRSATERLMAWNDLQTRMMQLDEQIHLARQRIAQEAEEVKQAAGVLATSQQEGDRA